MPRDPGMPKAIRPAGQRRRNESRRKRRRPSLQQHLSESRRNVNVAAISPRTTAYRGAVPYDSTCSRSSRTNSGGIGIRRTEFFWAAFGLRASWNSALSVHSRPAAERTSRNSSRPSFRRPQAPVIHAAEERHQAPCDLPVEPMASSAAAAPPLSLRRPARRTPGQRPKLAEIRAHSLVTHTKYMLLAAASSADLAPQPPVVTSVHPTTWSTPRSLPMPSIKANHLV